jgi:hypothetical protein
MVNSREGRHGYGLGYQFSKPHIALTWRMAGTQLCRVTTHRALYGPSPALMEGRIA